MFPEIDDKPETNGTAEKTNGHSEAPVDDPQPGTSAVNDNESSNDVQETDNDDADDGGNLELAWEVLLNAAAIFERQEQNGLSNLLDVYTEMAGISLENGNFEASMKDFNRALDVFSDLEDADQNQRIAAEIHYKIGLCQTMEKQYDESVKSFQTAADLLSGVVTVEKARENKDEDVIATIRDLEEMHQEILNKIIEIGETKAEEMEQVKREMLKMFGPGAGSSDGAGSSSSSSAPVAAATASSSKSPEEANKPKPTDISHLIKRKKPDTDTAVEESPAKKKAVETSPGEKIAVPVESVAVEKVAEEAETVQVIDN
jgi:nuclear autoantigenic sperm protein